MADPIDMTKVHERRYAMRAELDVYLGRRAAELGRKRKTPEIVAELAKLEEWRQWLRRA